MSFRKTSALYGANNIQLMHSSEVLKLEERIGTAASKSWECTATNMFSNKPFKRRVKSHLPFPGIIRNSPYSPR